MNIVLLTILKKIALNRNSIKYRSGFAVIEFIVIYLRIASGIFSGLTRSIINIIV